MNTGAGTRSVLKRVTPCSDTLFVCLQEQQQLQTSVTAERLAAVQATSFTLTGRLGPNSLAAAAGAGATIEAGLVVPLVTVHLQPEQVTATTTAAVPCTNGTHSSLLPKVAWFTGRRDAWL